MTNSTEERLRRLRYRAWHRGTRELDLILGTFADTRLANMEPGDIDDFETLISHDDSDIYGWIVGNVTAPVAVDTPVLQRIRQLDFLDLGA